MSRNGEQNRVADSPLRHLFQYGWGELGSRIPLILCELFIIRVLDPAEYGVWALFQIAVNYNNFSHLGLIPALSIEEPKALGGTRLADAGQIRNTTAGGILAITIAIAIVTASAAAFGVLDSLAISKNIVILFVGLIFTQQSMIYAQTLLQNHLKFSELSGGKLFYSLCFLAGVLILVPVLELPGAILAWLTAFALTTAFYAIRNRFLVPQPIIDLSRLRSLLAIGFPLFIFGIVKLGLLSFDKIAVGLSLGKAYVGYYNVSAAILVMIALFGTMVSKVYSPHMMRSVGRNQPEKDLFTTFMRVLTSTGCLLATASGGAIICLQPLIWYYVPDYAAGLAPGKILLMSGTFAGLTQVISTFLMGKGKQKALVFAIVTATLIGCALAYLASLNKMGLLSFALASAIAWGILTITLGGVIYKTANCEEVRTEVFIGLCRSASSVILLLIAAYAISAVGQYLHFNWHLWAVDIIVMPAFYLLAVVLALVGMTRRLKFWRVLL